MIVLCEMGFGFFIFNFYINGGILVFLTHIYKRVVSGSGPGFCKNPDPTRTHFEGFYFLKPISDPIIYRAR